MLGISEIVAIVVIVAIFILIFKFLQVFASQLTNYSAGSTLFSEKGWAGISRLMTYMLIIIIILITFLWALWHFLKFISPSIFGLGYVIIKIMHTFAQTVETGLF